MAAWVCAGFTTGDWFRTVRSGAPEPAFDRDWVAASERVATTDWAELRPRVDSEVGWTRRVMSSLRRLLSRAMTRVMSRFVRSPTSAKVREISLAVLACAGERVVSGPVTTTPVASP